MIYEMTVIFNMYHFHNITFKFMCSLCQNYYVFKVEMLLKRWILFILCIDDNVCVFINSVLSVTFIPLFTIYVIYNLGILWKTYVGFEFYKEIFSEIIRLISYFGVMIIKDFLIFFGNIFDILICLLVLCWVSWILYFFIRGL